jgi:hypothetical protein
LRLLAATLLCLAVALLSGCAGTAKGRSESIYSSLDPGEVAPPGESRASALVTIRYPAMIHAAAENLYVSSFAINAIGGEVPYAVHGRRQTARVAQSVVEKSSYYAMSLYRELKNTLPEGSVLLAPHMIDWDKERGLYSRPILASEQVPSVLTIDFNVYSFPDVGELMNAPPVTFGDLVTPLIVIRANRWAQPSLDGLLLSSPPLADSSWRQVRAAAREDIQRRLADQVGWQDESLAFIAYLRERDEADLVLPLRTNGAGQGVVAIEQYALEKIQMDGEQVDGLPEDHSVDPFVQGFARGAVARIVALLNGVNHDTATFFARQQAIERFDPQLARVFFTQSNDESVRARVQLAEALIGAEREFLAAQSDSIYVGTYDGNYGNKMRNIIAAEYRMLEQRRELARKQNLTAAVAVVALAGSVYGAVASTAAGTAAVTAASGMALAGAGWAIHESLQTRTESKEVNRYFLARMAPAFDRQMAVQMEWLESKEVITARGFAEFRNKTLALYQSRVRSMQVDAPLQCEFKHPQFNTTGRWFGACSQGLAEGRGYGVVAGGQDRSVEYLGEARRGLASGAGGMILQQGGQAGAIYFEGEFRNGLPDGVVSVEVAGEAPRLRRYSAGADIGRGSAAQLQRLQMASGQAAGAGS